MAAWDLSVLMTVYGRVDPAHLERALRSVAEQTRPPQEMVVVEDGALTPSLYAVLDGFRPRFPVRRVALPENRGSGLASQAGLELVDCPWTARADADDISLPQRFEVQLQALEDAGRRGAPVDVVGSAMLEFVDTEDDVVGVRRLPGSHAEVARYVRINNPVNHPTVVYRTEAVRAVGGYRHVPLMEDYDVMARLVAHGCRFQNVDDPLLLFRASPDMFRRRKARGMLAAELRMQRNLRAYGLTTGPLLVRNLVVRSVFRALPQPLLRRVYRTLFHR